jgi:hypothetical protein
MLNKFLNSKVNLLIQHITVQDQDGQNKEQHSIIYNAFKLGENFYIQNNGLVMGNPLSPFLTNLFMSEFESIYSELDRIAGMNFPDEYQFLEALQ